MKKTIWIISVLLMAVCCASKDPVTVIEGGTGTGEPPEPTPPTEGTIKIPQPNSDALSYMDLHDALSDVGQFYMPEPARVPKYHWTCVIGQDKNALGRSSAAEGLQYHLLCQSLAGLTNRALSKGETNVGIWLEQDGLSYDASKQILGGEIGRQTAVELSTKGYGEYEGEQVDPRAFVKGFVLTDVEKNPESAVVASVAAHVYDAIIVDVRDRAFFEGEGYELLYDASSKSTSDAWHEFRDKCSNKALVVMPVQTAELREFAIANDLFVINLNKKQGIPSAGQNSALFDEVLSWLEPNAPVLGWEQGVGEDVFVEKVSATGHLMLASDWSYNHSLTSVNYTQRQKPELAAVVNPREIDYNKSGNFVSFFLSDGDNYQWVMGDGFINDFYSLSEGRSARMSYGLCSEALSQLSPERFGQIFEAQKGENTLMECFGGGYFYVDNYATRADRPSALKVIAQRAAAHMRQHRIKVLNIIALDVKSEATKQACQAFVDANDELEGIIAIQYSPYNGGEGQVLWCRNSSGYDIPVITTKYSLWKGGNHRQGSPAEIAALMKADNAPYCAVCVHAWSDFEGKRAGAAAADCLRMAGSGFKAVNAQELVWLVRMKEREDQTLKYLATIK